MLPAFLVQRTQLQSLNDHKGDTTLTFRSMSTRYWDNIVIYGQ